jgi:hypothetical protein
LYSGLHCRVVSATYIVLIKTAFSVLQRTETGGYVTGTSRAVAGAVIVAECIVLTETGGYVTGTVRAVAGAFGAYGVIVAACIVLSETGGDVTGTAGTAGTVLLFVVIFIMHGAVRATGAVAGASWAVTGTAAGTLGAVVVTGDARVIAGAFWVVLLFVGAVAGAFWAVTGTAADVPVDALSVVVAVVGVDHGSKSCTFCVEVFIIVLVSTRTFHGRLAVEILEVIHEL